MAVFRSTTYGADVALQSPKEAYSSTDATAIRKIIVAGSRRMQAELDFIGYPLLITSTNPNNGLLVNFLSRVTPHEFQPAQSVIRGNRIVPPFLPPPQGPVQLPAWVYCRNVMETRPVTLPTTDDNDIGQGLDTEMTLGYRALDYEIREDGSSQVNGSQFLDPAGTVPNPLWDFPDEGNLARYVSRYYQDAGRFVIPGKGFEWSYFPPIEHVWDVGHTDDPDKAPSVGAPIPEGQAIFEARTRLTYVLREWPITAVDWSALTSLEGCVNLYPFDPYHYVANPNDPIAPNDGLYPETVMYTGWDWKQGRTADGQICGDVYLKFTYQPNVDLGTLAAKIPPFINHNDPFTKQQPRGWNWRLVVLAVPIEAVFGEGVVMVDYRPMGAGTFKNGVLNIGNPPYRVADLNTLFRVKSLN